MNSIRQLANFVKLDGETFKPLGSVLSLKNLARWCLNDNSSFSMLQLIHCLENLPESTWGVDVSPKLGTIPFTIQIIITPAGGGISSSKRLFKDGQEIAALFYVKTGPTGTYFVDIATPGIYKVVINKEYIDKNGYHNVTSEVEIVANKASDPPPNPQPGTNNITMRVIANQGIFIDQVFFEVKGPGAPQQPIAGINQLGQFFASITVPEPPANQLNQYSVRASAAYHTNEFGIGQPLQSQPTSISLGKDNIGMLFTLGFIPQTDQFYLNWTGNM